MIEKRLATPDPVSTDKIALPSVIYPRAMRPGPFFITVCRHLNEAEGKKPCPAPLVSRTTLTHPSEIVSFADQACGILQQEVAPRQMLFDAVLTDGIDLGRSLTWRNCAKFRTG